MSIQQHAASCLAHMPKSNTRLKQKEKASLTQWINLQQKFSKKDNNYERSSNLMSWLQNTKLRITIPIILAFWMSRLQQDSSEFPFTFEACHAMCWQELNIGEYNLAYLTPVAGSQFLWSLIVYQKLVKVTYVSKPVYGSQKSMTAWLLVMQH